MTASERRVLMHNLVADATDAAINKDVLRIGYFERTGSLMHFTKSDADRNIRPQGAVSKIDIHLTHNRAEEDFFSYLGCSGATEDGETFMSMNGLRSSCLARSTRVFEVRKCIFMSGT